MLFSGCSAGEVSNMKFEKTAENEKTVDTTAEDTKGSIFPVSYENEDDRVKFQCELEIPQDMTTRSLKAGMVKNKIYADAEKAYARFVDGKEVREKHTNPPSDGLPETNIYIMEDDSYAGIGDTFSYSTAEANFYSNAGVNALEKYEFYEENPVTFAKPEECIEEIKSILSEIGFPMEEFTFNSYPVSGKEMEMVEGQRVSEGLIMSEQKKSEWTDEDDGYFIYAYQKFENLPIFHEFMSISNQLAFDTPDGAPIQALYTTRGIEQLLSVMAVYDIERTDESLTLKNFDEIAAVVAEKFNSILNDAQYVVNRAKLFEMVRMNQKQEYEVLPVWYFEVAENGESKSVTLVDAVTGKEIYLN